MLTCKSQLTCNELTEHKSFCIQILRHESTNYASIKRLIRGFCCFFIIFVGKENQHMIRTPIDTDNPEFQNALRLIQYTRQSVFLTGKAGTGKSTFLKHVCQVTKKKYVVLAPTGIAAINAGGSTLHSFFKLPFHPLLPDDPNFSLKG